MTDQSVTHGRARPLLEEWHPLPAPHSKVRITVTAYHDSICLAARGAPDALVDAGLALPEWIPAGRKGVTHPRAPDGSSWRWGSRGPNQATWHLYRRTSSLVVARSWPGVPADIAFAVPEPTPAVPEARILPTRSAAEWKARMLDRLHAQPLEVVREIVDVLRFGEVFVWEDARFELAPIDAYNLLTLHEGLQRALIDQFARAQVIDRRPRSAAHGLRLVVDNTR